MATIEYFPEYDCTEKVIEGALSIALVTYLARYRLNPTSAGLVTAGMAIAGVVEGVWLATLAWGILAMAVDEVTRKVGKDLLHAGVKIPLFAVWVGYGFSPQAAMALTALYAVEGETAACVSIWGCLVRSCMASGPNCTSSLLPVTLLLADGIPSVVSYIYRGGDMPQSVKQRLSAACAIFSVFLMLLVAVTHAVTSTSTLSFMAGGFVLTAHVNSLLQQKKYSTTNLSAPEQNLIKKEA